MEARRGTCQLLILSTILFLLMTGTAAAQIYSIFIDDDIPESVPHQGGSYYL